MTSRPILLQASKPTGRLHQEWRAQLLAQSGDWLITHTDYGTSVRHYTKKLTYTMQHSNVGIFNAKEFYNVFIDFHANGEPKMLYINIATPATMRDGVISWIDLELDIVRLPGTPAELIDQDEFEEAKERGVLSAELARKAALVATQLMQRVDKGAFPFLMSDRRAATKAIAEYLACPIDQLIA